MTFWGKVSDTISPVFCLALTESHGGEEKVGDGRGEIAGESVGRGEGRGGGNGRGEERGESVGRRESVGRGEEKRIGGRRKCHNTVESVQTHPYGCHAFSVFTLN